MVVLHSEHLCQSPSGASFFSFVSVTIPFFMRRNQVDDMLFVFEERTNGTAGQYPCPLMKMIENRATNIQSFLLKREP